MQQKTKRHEERGECIQLSHQIRDKAWFANLVTKNGLSLKINFNFQSFLRSFLHKLSSIFLSNESFQLLFMLESSHVTYSSEKSLKQEKKFYLMKRHSFLIDKKPLRIIAFSLVVNFWKESFLFFVCPCTQGFPYFTKLELFPSDKFISSAYTFLIDSWMECNKCLSHWCCWYEFSVSFKLLLRGIILIKRTDSSCFFVCSCSYRSVSSAQSFNYLGVFHMCGEKKLIE